MEVDDKDADYSEVMNDPDFLQSVLQVGDFSFLGIRDPETNRDSNLTRISDLSPDTDDRLVRFSGFSSYCSNYLTSGHKSIQTGPQSGPTAK